MTEEHHDDTVRIRVSPIGFVSANDLPHSTYLTVWDDETGEEVRGCYSADDLTGRVEVWSDWDSLYPAHHPVSRRLGSISIYMDIKAPPATLDWVAEKRVECAFLDEGTLREMVDLDECETYEEDE